MKNKKIWQGLCICGQGWYVLLSSTSTLRDKHILPPAHVVPGQRARWQRTQRLPATQREKYSNTKLPCLWDRCLQLAPWSGIQRMQHPTSATVWIFREISNSFKHTLAESTHDTRNHSTYKWYNSLSTCITARWNRQMRFTEWSVEMALHSALLPVRHYIFSLRVCWGSS